MVRIGEKEDIMLCPAKFYRGGKTKFLMVDSSKGLSINVVKSYISLSLEHVTDFIL